MINPPLQRETGCDFPDSLAINTEVKDPQTRAMLEASTELTLDTYDETQRAHTRGALDTERARRTVRAMHDLFVQWADALGL
jgi:hypothetical protein